MSKRILSICMIFIIVTFGQVFAQSESYLDTIYTAQQNGNGELRGIVRILEGKSNKTAVVKTITPKTLPQEKAKPKYDPVAEAGLMNDIYKAVNRVTISLKTRKVVNTRVIGNTRAGTSVSIKTKSVSGTSSPQKTSTTIKSISRNLTREEIRIRDAKRYIDLLTKMGYEIEGGVYGEGGLWTLEQLQYLHYCIATLPVTFSRTTKTFRRVTDFMGRKSVMGYVYPGTPRVYLCDWSVRPTKFEETIVHEMSHVWMFAPENKAAKDSWEKTFWASGKRPEANEEQTTSLYGATNVYEDFAESVRYYWQNCAKMRLSHPKRWEFIRKYVFENAYWKSDRKVESTGSSLWVPKP